MTSVEWLVEKLTPMNWTKEFMLDFNREIIEQAKEMEKQQIIDAYDKGQENPFEYSEDNEVNYYDGNNYYNETFKK